MSHHPRPASVSSDRRKAMRHYLTHPMRAEIVWGRQRFAVESGAISSVSEAGVSVRLRHHMKAAPKGIVTVAVPHQDKVITLAGRVASFNSGSELGIAFDAPADNPLLDMLGRELDSASVSMLSDGRAQVTGNLTLAARHPMKWAVDAGAVHFDMSGVTRLDVSGIGLLLKYGDSKGIRLGECSPCVCRLVRACVAPALCAANCKKAAA